MVHRTTLHRLRAFEGEWCHRDLVLTHDAKELVSVAKEPFGVIKRRADKAKKVWGATEREICVAAVRMSNVMPSIRNVSTWGASSGGPPHVLTFQM